MTNGRDYYAFREEEGNLLLVKISNVMCREMVSEVPFTFNFMLKGSKRVSRRDVVFSELIPQTKGL